MDERALQGVEKLLEENNSISLDQLKRLKVESTRFLCFNVVAGGTDLATNVDSINARLIRELKVVREVLERGLLLAINDQSPTQFDRAQREVLGIYFNDFVIANIGPSVRQALVVGSILLWHLVNDSLEQFHLMVHRMSGIVRECGGVGGLARCRSLRDGCFFGILSSEMSERDRLLLDYPIRLERDILDGNISGVLMSVSTDKIPTEYFEWFSDQLTHTLRNRMASSIESSYLKISMDKLQSLLGFSTRSEVALFVDRIRAEKEFTIAGLAAQRNTQDLFAVKWVCSDTPSDNLITDRPSTPTSLPKPGEGKVFANLARTATASLGSRAFSLTKQTSTENVKPPPGKPPTTTSASYRTTTDGPFRLDANKQGNQLWLLSHERDQITFKQLTKSKPLIPAQELMRNWIGYAMDLECSM